MTSASPHKKRLALLGAFPPPYGGVAVHIERLRPLLDERGVSHHTYNAVTETEVPGVSSVVKNRSRWFLRYLATGEEDVVYLFSDRLSAWTLAAAACRVRRKSLVINLRNSRLLDWMDQQPWKAEAAARVLREATLVVAVSRKLEEACWTLGIDKRRVVYAPAFLPPPSHDVDNRGKVADGVWEFVGRHPRYIAANGNVKWHEGEDLYGIDLMVELMGRLKDDEPDLGMVICFWNHSENDQAYLDQLIARADELGVRDRILFNTAIGQFVPVLKDAALFLRPTNTDGDAVSVRESLYLGVPTVVSDAVERPPGALLHRSRDIDDLEAKARQALRGEVDRNADGGLAENQRVVEHYLQALGG